MPDGKLTVVAYDEPVSADKFAVADTLTEDGRIGKVADVQGIVTIKPVLHQRWTPVRAHLVLRPGDWLRTDARGANATAIKLVKQVGIILGPKTLVELTGPTQVRLLEGEIEVSVPAGALLDLVGPDGKKVALGDGKLFRVDQQRVVQVKQDPPVAAWLQECQRERGARLAGRAGRWPQCAPYGGLSQGIGRYTRPDRAHRDRRIVCQPYERAA